MRCAQRHANHPAVFWCGGQPATVRLFFLFQRSQFSAAVRRRRCQQRQSTGSFRWDFRREWKPPPITLSSAHSLHQKRTALFLEERKKRKRAAALLPLLRQPSGAGGSRPAAVVFPNTKRAASFGFLLKCTHSQKRISIVDVEKTLFTQLRKNELAGKNAYKEFFSRGSAQFFLKKGDKK